MAITPVAEEHHHTKHGKNKPTIPVSAGEPGYGLGIAGFVTSFFVSVVGLVLSAIALHQSKEVNRKNTLAKAGFIIGLVFTILHVLGILAVGGFIAFMAATCSHDPSSAICSSQNSSNNSPYYNSPQDGTRNSI